jgi:hypothetical protein
LLKGFGRVDAHLLAHSLEVLQRLQAEAGGSMCVRMCERGGSEGRQCESERAGDMSVCLSENSTVLPD